MAKFYLVRVLFGNCATVVSTFPLESIGQGQAKMAEIAHRQTPDAQITKAPDGMSMGILRGDSRVAFQITRGVDVEATLRPKATVETTAGHVRYSW